MIDFGAYDWNHDLSGRFSSAWIKVLLLLLSHKILIIFSKRPRKNKIHFLFGKKSLDFTYFDSVKKWLTYWVQGKCNAHTKVGAEVTLLQKCWHEKEVYLTESLFQGKKLIFNPDIW